MSYEVELKFRTVDQEDLVRRLESLGGEASPWIDQEDIYLSHPARDFARTGEALRLRREGESDRLTYKGPKHGGPTKTREEIEIAYEEGIGAHQQMRRLWDHLGFRPVAVLHQRRQTFHLAYRGRPV